MTQPQLTALTTALAAASVSAQAAKVAAAALVDPAQKAAITAAQTACNTVVRNLVVASTAAAILKGAVVTVPTVACTVAGLAVTASWTGSVSAKDWIGVYPIGAAGSAHLDWCYVNGTKTAGAVAPVGSATLNGIAGHFELRLMQNDTYTVIATSAPFDVAAPSQQPPPPVVAGLPISADFLPLASDPRGGDAAYTSLARNVDGKILAFGGFSHDRAGNNSAFSLDPIANAWSQLWPHTPWIDGPGKPMDVRGRNFICNRDNHNLLIVAGELWALNGQHPPDMLGQVRGKLKIAAPRSWTVDDDNSKMPGAPWQQNSACGRLDATTSYVFGGDKSGNPTDALSFVNEDGTVEEHWNKEGGPSFTGSQKLSFVASCHFVRQGKIYIYGGTREDWATGVRSQSKTLYQIEGKANPVMTVIAVNPLPNAVAGAVLVGYDATRDQTMMTDGKAVNVFDWATGKFVDVTVNTAADPDRQSPSPAEAPRAATFSPEAGGLVILGGHGRVYKLRLNYTGTMPIPTPPPVPPIVTPPTPPVIVPTTGTGTLKLVTTAVPLTGPARVLGAGKHFDFVKLGNRWTKLAGDHGGTGSPIDIPIPPPDLQDGRQEIISANIALNDWREDAPYYMPASDGVQAANPDDGMAIKVVHGTVEEAWVMNTATTRSGALPQPPGAAQQIDLLTKICAYSAPTVAFPRGKWRVVGPVPWVINGDRAWRGVHDPVKNRIFIPTNRNGAVWCMVDATTGADLTAYTAGIADQHGDFIFSVAGVAADFTKRLYYMLDLNTMALYSVGMDNPGWPTKVCQLPEFFPQGTQATVKLCWHPILRAVMVAAQKLHGYEVDSGKLTSWDRQDGFVNGVGKRVPTSTIFFDDETTDVVSIGTMDWDTGINPGLYWRLKISN